MRRHPMFLLFLPLTMLLTACAPGNAGTPTSGISLATPAPRPDGVRALAVDPRDGHLLEARSDGLFQSLDGGKSWQALALPADLAGKGVSQVAINKDRPDTVYLSGERIGIWRSRDAGKTWEKVTQGLSNEQVTALALHSNGYPRDDTTSLFVWVAGIGLFESRDEGDNWKRSPDKGPSNPDVLALTHSPLPGSMQTGWLYASTPEGAYLTMDCFCGWRAMGKLPGNAQVNAIVVDPREPKNVFAAGPAGVFRSNDTGLTWQPGSQGLGTESIAALALNPGQPDTLFAATADGALFRSDDGAKTWHSINAAGSG